MVLPDIIIYCARHSAIGSGMALFIQGAGKAVRANDRIFVKNNVKQVLVLHRIENSGAVALVHNEDIEEGVVRILTKLAGVFAYRLSLYLRAGRRRCHHYAVPASGVEEIVVVLSARIVYLLAYLPAHIRIFKQFSHSLNTVVKIPWRDYYVQRSLVPSIRVLVTGDGDALLDSRVDHFQRLFLQIPVLFAHDLMMGNTHGNLRFAADGEHLFNSLYYVHRFVAHVRTVYASVRGYDLRQFYYFSRAGITARSVDKAGG